MVINLNAENIEGVNEAEMQLNESRYEPVVEPLQVPPD